MKVAINPTFEIVKHNEMNQTEEYREYRRKWYENPREFVVGDFPIHVDLETNTNCNLLCYMCIHAFDKPKHVEMNPWLFIRIINEGVWKGLCSIKTQYRGEPLLYKHTVELVKYAKDRGVLEVMFNTNATLLNKETSLGLINAKLDKLLCSVEGCTKEVYESIRVGGDFNRVLSNIKTFQQLKKDRNLVKPVVNVQMVDTPRNHHTIEDSVRFWGGIVDNVGVSEMVDYNSNKVDDTPLKDWACGQLWQRLIVLADGDVIPCCRGVAGGNHKLVVLGNAYEMSLASLWKSNVLERLRELHKTGDSHKIDMCRLCGIRKQEIMERKMNNVL